METDAVTLGATVVPHTDDDDAGRLQNLAVSGPDGMVTYAQLSERTDHLAELLQRAGVSGGDLVGLCLDRSVSLVVAASAIFRAGCAYVAIDPRYPDDRIRWMLDDSGATALIGDAVTAQRFAGDAHRPCVVVGSGGETEHSPVPGKTDARPVRPGRADRPAATDLAYVVYTSGSTGRPKGVMIEHAGLANLVDWHRARLCSAGR